MPALPGRKRFALSRLTGGRQPRPFRWRVLASFQEPGSNAADARVLARAIILHASGSHLPIHACCGASINMQCPDLNMTWSSASGTVHHPHQPLPGIKGQPAPDRGSGFHRACATQQYMIDVGCPKQDALCKLIKFTSAVVPLSPFVPACMYKSASCQ